MPPIINILSCLTRNWTIPLSRSKVGGTVIIVKGDAILMIVGAVGFLLLADSKPNAVFFWSYPALAAAGYGAACTASRRLGLRWLMHVGLALTVGAIYLWNCHDTTIERWKHQEKQGRKIVNTEYSDTYTRWSHRHVHRDVSVWDGPEPPATTLGEHMWDARGPMAGTGKMHGEWTYTTWCPDFERKTRFFWYGDEISEGEWHLRNR